MSVKQNGMWSVDTQSTVILVRSLNYQNIYIKILTMCLPGQLFALHQKVIEHEFGSNLNEQCDSNFFTLFRNGIT